MEQTKQNSSIEMYLKDLEELDKIIQQTSSSNLKRKFEEIKNNLIFLLEEEKKKVEKSNQVTTKSQESHLSFNTVTKYAFDSGEKFAKIYLTEGFQNVKELPKENIIAKFNKKSFEVQILNLNNKNYKFNCANLNKEIIPEESYVKATGSGLTIFLKKVKTSDNWDALEYKKPLTPSREDKPDYLAKDPNAGLMDMMKEMYQSGDPEMKRIIAESFQKSGQEQNKFGGNLDM